MWLTQNDSELDSAVLALMLHHRDDTAAPSPRLQRRAKGSPRAAPASAMARTQSALARDAQEQRTASLVSASPRLNVAAASFTPRAAAPAAEEAPDEDEDEFSPFARTSAAEVYAAAAAPEAYLPDMDALVVDDLPMSPLDVFCDMLVTQHAELFGDRVHTAPQQIQAALERTHYDVQATMAMLQEAYRTGKPLATQVTPSEMPAQESLGGARVCRYFLAGECRRSDCRFSHDLNKALCRFWLRGQCLNEPCSFLHDFEALSVLASSLQPEPEPERRDEVVVPGAVPRRLDPAQTHWAAAVQKPSARPAKAAPKAAAPKRAGTSAARLMLRPPTLLPTLSTGTALSTEMGKLRAALGHGPAEHDAWTPIEALLRERHKRIREQLLVAAGGDAGGWGSSAQASDERGAQGLRGKWAGGVGLCLGVARQANLGKYAKHALSLDERTEVFLDMHGLYVAEALQACEHFLLQLERESFRGLAYLGVGAGKHSNRARGTKLHAHIRDFLQSWAYVCTVTDAALCRVRRCDCM